MTASVAQALELGKTSHITRKADTQLVYLVSLFSAMNQCEWRLSSVKSRGLIYTMTRFSNLTLSLFQLNWKNNGMNQFMSSGNFDNEI